ncbi:substrate-binding domain-containing protein [Enterococcus sp. 669A]|uniref:Substrate-binding domain-containing protein n=1 Tax=Candidatus Enterococcus moelleringii TaxID=2815325 RepID=A0ABS3LBW3_9ENTE|nr:substrate-binding domain-containing protein [Enterococcus sp. 669A]MBO1307122.1 substrate-binding domain-containing protein [Enterococcus sp. 669A]
MQALISGEREIIFISGWIPREQEEEAWKAGVELAYKEVARDGLVFLTNTSNPINNLTSQQLENIYSRKTTKWKTLGWEDGGDIIAYQLTNRSERPDGLQILLQEYAPSLNPYYLPEDELFEASSLMKQLASDQNGLGYAKHYLAETMYPNKQVKMLNIDGVYPSFGAISKERYYFDEQIYAATNGEPAGNIKLLIEWMLSEEGQYLVEETGYVPVNLTLTEEIE